MKKALLISLLITSSFFGWSQGFDPDDNSIYYTTPGPSLVQAQLVAGVWQDIVTFPMTRFNNSGPVNGLGCNPIDSCLYYINNSGGSCHLYRMDNTGLCTEIISTIGYTVNGGIDACGRYIQYQQSKILRYDLQTGFMDTIFTSNLGFITDIDYNPNTCNVVNMFYQTGTIKEIDNAGVGVQDIITTQPGTTQVGGVSITSDGSTVLLSKAGNIYSYELVSGTYIATTPLAVPAAGAPIADLATFQYDNVVVDITNGTDTMYFTSCTDSIDVTFSNYTVGDTVVKNWDFDDGTISSEFAPTHKFASNNTYEVVFMSTRFMCETCQIDDDNYDTIYVVITPDTLQTTLSSTDPICVTSTDGTADVIGIVGGTAPYVYLWPASGNITANETGLDAGWVFVEITGANGCFNTDSIFLTNPPAVEVNLALTDVVCFGYTDGSVIASPVNGPVVYTYTWSTSLNTTATENNVGAGNHNVVVQNLAGCDTTYLFTINEPSEVMVGALADTTICIGGTAILDAVPSGGNGGYTITWTGLGTGIQNVNPAVNTCYDVQVQDVNGCVSQMNQICVDLHAPLNLTVAGVDICPQDNAQLTSNTTGGFGTYNYIWDIGGSQVGTNADLSNAQSTITIYCLTVTDQCETPAVNNCITIDVYSEPVLNLTPQTICENESILFADPALIPAEVISYGWQFGDGVLGSGNQPTHPYPYSGLYTVTVIIESADNCIFQTDFVDLIQVDATPNALFNYNPIVVTVEDTEVDFFNNTIDGTTYVWDFGDGNSGSTEENPSHIYPPIAGSSYQVTLYAYNGVCQDSITQIVYVEDIIIYYIPNAFTPDGDEFNEEFKPIVSSGIDIYDYHLTIYDRWGEIIFQSYDLEYGWNGHYGDGGLVEDGTYVWALEFGETMSDKQHRNGGHVTVLK